jgi:phage terminase small subunit
VEGKGAKDGDYMTEKQKKFCDEYLIDLNATQAAIRAGYSPDSAEQVGYQLLHKTSVSRVINMKIAERSRRTGVNADRVVRELARLGFANIKNIANDDASLNCSASDDDLAAVQSVRVKKSDFENGSAVEREVKIYDKNKALELLGRHLGMWNDKISLDADMNLNITIDYGEENESKNSGK